MYRFRTLVAFSLFFMAGSVLLRADENISQEQLKFFETKIRPVLVRECYGCHSTEVGQIKGGLWLDTAEGSRTGGDSGPAVVPGNLNDSLLWSAINHDDFVMPPRKKLTAEVLADFRRWIEMGAPDPRHRVSGQVRSSLSAEDIKQGRQFWSFRLPTPAEVPDHSADWAQTNIDRFVFETLQKNQLAPASDAEPAVVLRRLTYDLVGLPPTPAQMSQFQKYWEDDPQSGIERVVDYLLAQPQFGERWARHWLDVARYAESTGKEVNMTFPHAWRYRDYVIDSFNDDKPYNRFVQEQVAGDLLPVTTDEQWAENLVATGFLVLGPKTLTEQNARQFEYDLIDEQIDVTTRVMLGVSVACARCHDHKFDPIPQADYYAMAGIFGSMTTHYGTLNTQQNRRPSNLVLLPVDDLSPWDKPVTPSELAQLQSRLADSQADLKEAFRQRRKMRNNSTDNNPVRNVLSVGRMSAQVGALEAKIADYDEQGNPLSYCMAVQESDRIANAKLLERGEFNRPAQEVSRGLPQVLCSQPVSIPSDSSGRLELARWIGSDENPLTARVMVNRVWLHLMGQGLVRTPENFGATGLPPTHPELLDYLAIEFMANDWSLKQLVRSIVVSRVYRMSSEFDRSKFEVDPDNKLLWRCEPKRLDAEVIRDSMLSISGQLDLARPRASVVARMGTAAAREGVLISSLGPGDDNRPASNGRDAARRIRNSFKDNRLRSKTTVLEDVAAEATYRSIFLPIVRDSVPRSLDVFDFAESTMVVGQRNASNTPDQGLYFLNNSFVIHQANSMADRLMKESDKLKDQLKLAFRLAYGREGQGNEIRIAESFFRRFQPTSSNQGPRQQHREKLSAICQSLMASAEFRYIQ